MSKGNDPVKKFFDTPENYLRNEFGIRLRAQLVRKLVGEIQGQYILDIGCGNGMITWQYVAKNEVFFLDLSEKMLELVRKRAELEGRANATIVNESVTDFVPTARFDFAIAIGVLAHISDVESFISHIKSRIIKPDGKVILQFSDVNSWIVRWRHRHASKYGYTMNKIDKVLLRAILERSGLRVKQSIRFGLLLPGMGRLPERVLWYYSLFILRSGIGRLFGTDYMWKIEPECGS